MPTYVKTLQDTNGNVILPRTRVEAITLSDGTTTIEDELDTINTMLSSKVEQSDIDTAITNKADKSTLTNTYLYTADWVGSESPYTLTLSVEDVTTTSIVEIYPSLTVTLAELEALSAAIITDSGQDTGELYLKAFGDKPTSDIAIRVVVRGDM